MRVAYISVLVLLVLLVLPGVLAEPTEDEQVRAIQARILLEVAHREGGDYAMSCGRGDVLNRADPLQTLSDYVPVACVLEMGDKKAVTFTTTAAPPDDVINHFAGYGDPAVNNVNIIKANDLDDTACNNPEDLGNGAIFGRCANFLEQKSDYKVYLYKTVGAQDPMVYLVTIDFRPYFDDTWWGGVIDFFKGLLGLTDDKTLGGESLEGFSRAYFAYAKDGSNTRAVKAFFQSNNPDNLDDPGTATIIYQNFSFDISAIAGDAQYYPGHDNTQVLVYERLLPDTWDKLTAALRLEATDDDPFPSDTCGNNILAYGEDCEDDGLGGFTAYAQSCEELGFSYGELACNPSTCKYDTSNCVSCEDKDGDGYWTAVGIPSEIKTHNPISIGSHAADTNYNNEASAYNDDRDLRENIGIGAQSFPLPIRHFTDADNFMSTFRDARDDLLAMYTVCRTENSTNACLSQAIATDTSRDAINILGGLVAQQMLADDNIEDEGQCARGQAWICPGGLTPSSFGFAATSYKEFLISMAEEGIEPIFFLDNAPYRLANTDEKKIESALTCAALSRGIKNTWENTEVAAGSHYGDLAANTYVYGYRNGIVNDSEMLNSYEACRIGLRAGQTAKLYYYPKTLLGIGTVVWHDHYANLARIVRDNPERAHGLVDGFITDNPDPYAVPSKKIKIEEGEYMRFVDLRKAIGAKLIVIVNNTDALTTGYKLVGAQRANARHILFWGIENPVSGEALGTGTTPSTTGAFVKEIMSTLADKSISSPSDTTLPQTHMIIAKGDETNVFVAFTQAGVDNVLPVEDCTEATIEKENEGVFEVIDEYVGSTGVYRFNMSDWECFLEGSHLATCAVSQETFDCNDTEDPIGVINPGAIEDCDDKIDNDCDGLVDTEDDCELDPLPPGEGCDFDGYCDPDNEEVDTCADCIRVFPCPQPNSGTFYVDTIGHYNISMRWDEEGTPQLIIEPDGQRPAGNSYDCQWGYPELNYPDTGSAEDTKEFPYTPSLRYNPNTDIAFRDSNGQIATVSVLSFYEPSGFTGWRIKYYGQGDQSAMRCWGLNDPHFVGFISDKINLFEHGYCSEKRCESQDDCGDGFFCAWLNNNYDFKMCMREEIILECFVPETQVTLADGGTKEIQDLQVGDLVLGYNEVTKTRRTQEIQDVMVHDTHKEILIINDAIKVTPEHLFYTAGAWIAAGELELGDELLSDTGETIIVQSLAKEAYEGTTYNLHTEPDNNYYAGGVLVHNRKLFDGPWENQLP